MDKYTATELAYKNGLEKGKDSILEALNKGIENFLSDDETEVVVSDGEIFVPINAVRKLALKLGTSTEKTEYTLKLTKEELDFIYDRCSRKAARLEESNLKDVPCYTLAWRIMSKIFRVKDTKNDTVGEVAK